MATLKSSPEQLFDDLFIFEVVCQVQHQTETNACLKLERKKCRLNSHCSQNLDQTVNLGSVDKIWIKIMLQHSLCLA